MTKKLLSVNNICEIYEIDRDFINELSALDVLDFEIKDSDIFIDEEELPVLEKIINLHYDLGVNVEGIDIIMNLLSKIEELEEELQSLKRRLDFYDL